MRNINNGIISTLITVCFLTKGLGADSVFSISTKQHLCLRPLSVKRAGPELLNEIRSSSAGKIEEATSSNPAYIAFRLYLDLTNFPPLRKEDIGQDYAGRLADFYEVSKKEIRAALKLLYPKGRRMNAGDVIKKTIKMIEKSLRDANAAEPEFYMHNILLPYLAFLSSQDIFLKMDNAKGWADSRYLSRFCGIEEEVFSLFKKAFGVKRGNPLKNLAENFKNKKFKSRYGYHLTRLNQSLVPHNFFVFLAPKISTGYAVIFSVKIGKRGIGNVLILKKTGVSLAGLFPGASIGTDKNVIVDTDVLNADLLRLTGYSDAMGMGRAFNGALKDFGLDCLPAEEKNRIEEALLTRNFRSRRTGEKITLLAYAIIIHEVKHKFDENYDNGSWKIMEEIDIEIPTYLTMSILEPLPVIGLGSLLRYMESRYFKAAEALGEHQGQADYPERELYLSVKKALLPIISKCWLLVKEYVDGEKDQEQLRAALRKIYEDYRTIREGRPLPPLKEFESEILPLIKHGIDENLDLMVYAVLGEFLEEGAVYILKDEHKAVESMRRAA